MAGCSPVAEGRRGFEFISITRGFMDPEKLLPLKPLELSILIALAEEERYGYDIVRRIAERSSGAVRLAPGNLYAVLDRMIGSGLIRQTTRMDADDERRRYYTTTTLGRRVLAAEAARLRDVLRTVEGLAVEGRSS